MRYIHIQNWEQYQHYKKRDPVWIKLYHRLLDNYEYGRLQDASKLLLFSLYMLAARTGNKIPADLDWIKSKAMIKGEVTLKELEDAGFISYSGDSPNCYQDASKPLATCYARDRDRDRDREDSKEGSKEPSFVPERSAPKKSKQPKCPQEEIKFLYHEILPELPKVESWPDHLQKILRARWRESPARQCRQWWVDYFTYVRGSDFLMGRKSEWQADLEWLIRPQNMTKVLNGRYHRQNGRLVGITEWLKKSEEKGEVISYEAG